ncbi:MAG: hypothetical protein DRN15_07260 [Thermoprotei archaeon]|nr:MAG: hypothetical protein DRN15_07260 [Thermoprotei archaeon]
MKSKLVATKLSSEEYRQVEEYARRRKISTYQAIRELVKLGLLRERFMHELLQLIEAYARVSPEFRLELERLLTSLEEL